LLAFIKGILESFTQKTVIIDVNGVGFEVNIPSNINEQLPPVGNNLQLYTHFYLREDQAQLYGFLQISDKELFKLLIEVSGVGPKLAMEILSNSSRDDFISAIILENIDFLKTIPGIGKKTAQRLIIELKDKLKKLHFAEPFISQPIIQNQPYLETIEALVGLGYKQNEVETVLQRIDVEDTSTDSLIRAVLTELGKE
jgi:Holliday junction DNA helicase RuvA